MSSSSRRGGVRGGAALLLPHLGKRLLDIADGIDAEQAGDATERLENRKTLDRAKGKLMDGHGLTEQAAFDFIQKSAMTSRRSMKIVADEILAGSLTP